jgi:SprT protein
MPASHVLLHPSRSIVMPDNNLFEKLRQQAETAVRKAENRARSFYGLKLPEAAIDFSLRGRCAGQAKIDRSGSTCLRINLQLLAENRDDFLLQTIPHEVSHLVVNWQVRNQRQRPRPHGPEWQRVMQECFGLAPTRCHNYKTSPARVVLRPFVYRCNCREHHLTGLMHNRIACSYQALCKDCRSPIQFVAKQAR